VGIDSQIDTQRRLVFTTVQGDIDLAAALDHTDRLRAHPDFDPAMNQLFDMRAVGQISLTADDLRTIAAANVLGPGVRRAVVAPTDLSFGVARQLEFFLTPAGHEVQVFRDIDEARQWLGLDPSDDGGTKP